MAIDRSFVAPRRTVPAVPGWDHSLAFLRDPYRFIGRSCRALGSDIVQMRLLLQPTLCLTGPEAARLFYDKALFRRRDAAPEPVRATLFGKGGVQALDGPDHLARKRFFLAVAAPARTATLVAHAEREWERLARGWHARGEFVLYPAAQEWLACSACRWAGLPLAPAEVSQRTAELAALFDGAARSFGAHLRARQARGRLEGWIAQRIEAARAGRPLPPGTAASAAAGLVDAQGGLLPAPIAAVELLNVVRPIVAVSVYVVLAVHALHRHPVWAATIASGGGGDLDAFVQEVRRFYPFFPAVAARTCQPFEWQGRTVPAGMRALLDLHGTNHDPRAWVEPDAFRPERFFGLAPGPFEFVPQGGGRAETHHRCPGEGITVALVKLALRQLVTRSRYRVPAQDDRLEMRRMPALPASRMVLADFRPA